MVMVLASCGTNQNGKDEEPVSTPDPELVKNTVNATIELEDGDEIILELYPDRVLKRDLHLCRFGLCRMTQAPLLLIEL